jgi:arginyl-tRNA synthetase
MIEEKIRQKIREALSELYNQDVTIEPGALQKTRKEFEGDFTIVVFPYTRISRKSPEATAAEIGNFLLASLDELKEFRIIKGFLNLELKDSFWTGFLNETASDESYGFNRQSSETPVVLEYSSPNTNKPLHLGHIRNNLLGYSLSRILSANGKQVARVNLVNDRGIHICKSMLAYMKWGNGETPASSGMKGDHLVGKYYVLFDRHYKEQVNTLIAKGETEEEAMRKAPLIMEAQETLRRWEARDTEIRSLWHTMNSWTYEGFDVTYRNLGVEFDKVNFESETYLLGKELVKDGLAAGVLSKRDDGSVWIDLSDEGLDEKLLLRSDGTSVYMTQDLGTAQMRYDEYHPAKMIYVVGNEQNYHFDVLKLILKKLGRPWSDKIFHLSYGMVELPEGRMKSREGTVVDADDLMDEMYRTAEETTRELGKVNDFPGEEASNLFRMLGLGALKYFILKVDPKKNMLFDPKESIDFNGNTGPFLQYTHARIRSLIRKAGYTGKETGEISVTSILPREREILRIIYQFPAIIQQAGDEMSPALVANYIYELAKEYNSFYQEVPVLREEDHAKMMFRLAVSDTTGKIIRSGLGLLGIDVPERM